VPVLQVRGQREVRRGNPANDAILVDCRSIAAATYLKHKIETGPLDASVFVYSIPDEQPATPSLN